MSDINFDEINQVLQDSEQPKQQSNTISLSLDQIRELLNNKKPQEVEKPKVKKEKKPMSEKKQQAVQRMLAGRRKQIEQQKQQKQPVPEQQPQANYPKYQHPFEPVEVDMRQAPYIPPPQHNPQMNYLTPEQVYYPSNQQRGQVYDYSVPQPAPQSYTQTPLYSQPATQPNMYEQSIPQVARYHPKSNNDVFSQLGFQHFDSKSSKQNSTKKTKAKVKTRNDGRIDPFSEFR